MLSSTACNDDEPDELRGPVLRHYKPLIRRLESITTLSPEDCGAIAAMATVTKMVSAGQDIVQEGAQVGHCCILLDGWAYRYKILEEGKRQILSFHIPGEIPDLSSLHLPVPDYTLGVLTSGTIALIQHEVLHQLTHRHPGLARALWHSTLVDATIYGEWIARIGRRRAPSRLAHLFCELYQRMESVGLAQGYRCVLPLKQTHMADALGLTSVHVNRSIRDLRNRQLVSIQKGQLEIKDWRALAKLAEFNSSALHLRRGELHEHTASTCAGGDGPP